MPSYDLRPTDYPKNVWVMIKETGSGAKGQGSFSLQLPLPHQLMYDNQYDWSADPIDFIAQSIAEIGTTAFRSADSSLKNNPKAFGDAIANAGEGVFNNVVQQFKDGALSSAVAQTGMQGMKRLASVINADSALGVVGTSADNIAKAFGKSTGVAYNPNKQLFFNGVSQNEFTLSFDIVPQSKTQAHAAASGIKQLRVLAAPDYQVGRAFFTYPSYFSLDISVLGNTILTRPQFAITRIATNLAPSSAMSWHEDGMPVAYTLDIGCYATEVRSKTVEQSITFLGK